LSRSIHSLFGALNLGLEPVEGSLNKYKVICYEALPFNAEHPDLEDYEGSVFVTLRNHSQCQVDLPNPLLLQIHCACVRIKHLSGHADIIDDLVQEEEDGFVAWDGSTNLGSLWQLDWIRPGCPREVLIRGEAFKEDRRPDLAFTNRPSQPAEEIYEVKIKDRHPSNQGIDLI
jgi:hypothetical protein